MQCSRTTLFPKLLLTTFLALLWLSRPSLAATFLSIDCGASDPYTDENSIRWVGDDDYVGNGEPQLVEFSTSLPSVVNTLRSFPTLSKNCYSVGVDKGERLLVRASFYYGNYDGRDSAPTFDLYYDGNYWTKVNLSTDSNIYVHYEVIYTAKRNTTSICLAQRLPDQIPFITALELRSLDDNMYNRVGPDDALFFVRRAALGATRIVRYPDDDYDRMWYPAYGIELREVTSEATSIDVSTAQDKPPAAVLQNATVAGNISVYLIIYTRLPEAKVPVYMNLYFSEVTTLASSSTQKRSFQLYVDENPYLDQPIVPPFGSVLEVSVTNISASSQTSFTLRPTPDSTLPPLINAFEVYEVENSLALGTDSRDVEGLVILQIRFEILLVWSGDPCLPSAYAWEWVQCSKDKIPRVISLNLSSFGLFGSLPDFSSMDALVTIDLHNNSLYGPIPDFLGSLPKLKRLDLSDNRFSGTIPTSLRSNNNLDLEVTGNCLSGMSCPPPPPSPPPPPPPQTPSSSERDNDNIPPPPPLAFRSGDSPFLSGSLSRKNTHKELTLVLGVVIEVFLMVFFFINF